MTIKVPKRACDRLLAGMRTLKPIVEQLQGRDVSEADTVTLVKDILSDAFGYDKYAELTGEHAIRGTYCDILIQIDEKPMALVEVKAAGIELDDRHVKQAIDYAANQGVEWVVLTNAAVWRMYHVEFTRPIDKYLLCEVDVASITCRKVEDAQCLYLFSREAMTKSGVLQQAMDRQQATSRYMVAALLVGNDRIHNAIRRELKRVVDVAVDVDEIVDILRDEVVKRDSMDGQPFEDALRLVNKKEDQPMRKSKPHATPRNSTSPSTAPDGIPAIVAASSQN